MHIFFRIEEETCNCYFREGVVNVPKITGEDNGVWNTKLRLLMIKSGSNSFHCIVSSRAQQTRNGEQKEKAEGENGGGSALSAVASAFPASSI